MPPFQLRVQSIVPVALHSAIHLLQPTEISGNAKVGVGTAE